MVVLPPAVARPNLCPVRHGNGSDQPMTRRTRFGIAFRSIAGLALMAFLVIAASLIAILSFEQERNAIDALATAQADLLAETPPDAAARDRTLSHVAAVKAETDALLRRRAILLQILAALGLAGAALAFLYI